MIAELIGPDDARWRQLLQATRHDVYHLPGYGSLYERASEAREVALYVQGGDAELLVPLMLRPLPALGDPSLSGWWDALTPYGYPGPLVRGAFLPGEVELFRDRVFEVLREHRILTCFLRGSPFLVQEDTFVQQLGTVVVHGDLAIIELDRPDEEIWNGYASDQRRKIRRLVKLGYTVRIDEWADLTVFLALYRETMQRVGATPFYFFGDDYFSRLKALLGDRLHIFSVLSPEGEVVSAALNTSCGGIAQGHLNATASAHLPLAPASLLYDEGWRHAKRLGDQYFNYGGGLGGGNDSLFRFKRQFTSTTRPFRTFRIVCDERLYQRACAAAGVSGEDRTGFFPAYRKAPAEARPQARAPGPASPRASPAAGCPPGA